jgi:hypothetical protein
MAVNFQFTATDAPSPIAVTMHTDKDNNYRLHPKTGLVQFSLLLNPVVMGDLLQWIQTATPDEREIPETIFRSIIAKEAGGLLYIQKYPYLARSYAVAAQMVTTLFGSDNHLEKTSTREAIKFFAAVQCGQETAGYLFMGRYLSNQSLTVPQLKTLLSQDRFSTSLKNLINTVAVIQSEDDPKQPDAEWRAALAHVYAHVAITEGNMSKEQQIAYIGALLMAEKDGLTASLANGVPRPVAVPGQGPINPALLRYLVDPYYKVATPEAIQAICQPGLGWFWLSESSLLLLGSGLLLWAGRARREQVEADKNDQIQKVYDLVVPEARKNATLRELKAAWPKGDNEVLKVLKRVGISGDKKTLSTKVAQIRRQEIKTSPQPFKRTIHIVAVAAGVGVVFAILQAIDWINVSALLQRLSEVFKGSSHYSAALIFLGMRRFQIDTLISA